MILVFQILLAISIIGILFIILKKIPLLLETPRYSEEGGEIYKVLRDKWKETRKKCQENKVLQEKVIPKTEKVLRRTKIILLKLDNFLAKKLNRIRKRKRGEEEE